MQGRDLLALKSLSQITCSRQRLAKHRGNAHVRRRWAGGRSRHRPLNLFKQDRRNIGRQEWLMPCRGGVNGDTSAPQLQQSIGGPVLILHDQGGNQIVEVNHFSTSRSRFEARKEN